jgi:predicted GIY-YIG superfamily endonuclease
MYFKRKQKIYVAYLPYGKKYIGHTRNFKRRLNQHFLRKGSKVTRKYKPKYIKPIKDCYGEGKCKYQEQILVNKMIDKYGYDKVRGGRYTNSENF